MAVSVLLLLLIAVFAVSLRTRPRGGSRQSLGVAVRRFFQYGVQFALVCITATGLSILLARVLQRDVLVAGDREALAQGLSFTLVGVPLLWLLARWSRRRLAADAQEAASVPWGWYLSLAELVPLAVAATSLQDVLLWALRAQPYDADAVARTVMWGAAWAVHLRLTRRTTPLSALRDHELAGAGFGLWTATSGLAGLVAASLQSLLATSGKDLLVSGASPLARGGVGLAVGAGMWALYWLQRVHRAPRTLHWHVYVLIAGVGAGLVAALASASVVLYDVLVWFLGTPDTSVASLHFRGSMTALGAFLAGGLVWWYHRTVLREAGAAARDEAQRVYEYVVSVIALAAAATGVMILLVALVESLTASVQIAGAGAGNTLLLAVTLLVVGAPLWWRFWRGIQRATAADPRAEAASPTRRVYLFVLFGLVGVAALVALLVATYQLFADLVDGTLGTSTLRDMRWGLSVVVTAAAVASYHWRVYRAEPQPAVSAIERRSLLLIGSADSELARELRRLLGHRVEVWPTAVPDGVAWTAEAVQAALADVPGEDVVVMAEQGRLRALAVQRD